jgi:nitrous oxidase accessory protein NosD
MKGGMFMLEDLTPPVKVFPCKVRDVAQELDESDSTIFMNAVANIAEWSNNGLAAELTRRGVYISEKAIRKHRRKECSC